MDIRVSDIVIPINGRDRGKRFVVIGRDGDYALLADGKSRRAEKPKRKKVRHIRFEAKLSGRVAEKLMSEERVLNSELRRALGQYEAEIPAGGPAEETKEVCTIAKRRHD